MIYALLDYRKISPHTIHKRNRRLRFLPYIRRFMLAYLEGKCNTVVDWFFSLDKNKKARNLEDFCMRKLLVFSVLLALLATAVFAELTIGFEAQVGTDLLYFTKGTEKITSTAAGVDAEYGKLDKGSFNFFSGNYAWGPGAALRLTFTHTTENTEASMQLKADKLLEKAITGAGTWNDILYSTFGDWYFQGTLKFLDAYVGNTGYGGKVDSFDNFNDFINSDEYFNALGGFGVWTPASRKTSSFQSSDCIDIWDSQVLALGLTFGNFKFAAGNNLKAKGFQEPYDSKAWANAAFIFSGDKIADLFSFDVFYAFEGQDEDTKKRDNDAEWNHRFGVYAGLTLNENLGISIGYTGDVKANESKTGADDKGIPVINPFYSGIDLHLNVALDKLGITFNNNISFAGVNGIEDNGKDKIVNGIFTSTPGKDISESWFAYSGGVLLSYNFSDDFAIAFQVADKIGAYTSKDASGSTTSTDTYTVNELRIALSGEFTVSFAKFGVGLNFGLSSYSEKNVASETRTDSTNIVSFGIPLYFRVSF